MKQYAASLNRNKITTIFGTFLKIQNAVAGEKNFVNRGYPYLPKAVRS